MAVPGNNAPYRMRQGNFEIEAGVFLKFAPHPMGATFEGEDGYPVKNALDAHARIHSAPQLLLRDSFKSSFWHVGMWRLRKRFVLSDVERSVENLFISWFERFDDLEAFRAHVLKIHDSGGRAQDTKRDPDSWGWVYGFKTLPAFLALYFQDWEEARRRLAALLAEAHPGHQSDPAYFPEALYHNIRDKLEEGLATAEAQL